MTKTRWLLMGMAGSAIMVGGCSLTNISDLTQALGQDQASLCAQTHVIYGIGNGRTVLCRANAPGTEVTINPDGVMTLKRAQEPKPADMAAQLGQIQQLATQIDMLRKSLQDLIPKPDLVPEGKLK